MRRFLCLFLALAVLILCPLRVAATSVVIGQAIVTGASALLVVAGILYGLGVMPSSDPTVFESTRDAGVEYLRAGGYVDDDGFMEIIGYQDPAGVLRSYVSQNIIESIRDWLFSENVVISTPGSGTIVSSSWSITDRNGTVLSPDTECYFVGYYEVKDSYTYIYYAFVPLDFVSNSVKVTCTRTDGSTFKLSGGYYPCNPSNSENIYIPMGLYSPLTENVKPSDLSGLYNMTNVSHSYKSHIQYILSGNVDGIYSYSATDGLVLGDVAGPDSKIDTDYETWVDESIISIDVGIQFEDDPEDPNDDDKNVVPWWPVHTGNSLPTGTVQEMQSAAQSGLTDLEIDFSGGSGSGDGTGTGSDSGGSSPGASWQPPSDHSQFALVDLKKYFPFCIPFDLFEFFSLLNADPVAPVFHWELQDLSGRSYSIDIDLSEWDSVAQTFRLLQLFLFITGLAAASRKFIKW